MKPLPRSIVLAVLAALLGSPVPAAASGGPDPSTAASSSFPLATDTSAVSGPTHWALVLSGGGARGIAHIGALRAIEEEGVRPDLVVGTSMGALVGALWVSGYSSGEITELMTAIDWEEVFDPRRLAPEWRRSTVARPWFRLLAGGRGLGLPAGLVDDSELNFQLSVDLLDAEAAAQGDFDRLAIPFRAVATDAADLKPVTISNGSVARSVRASISIPAVFAPVAQDSTILVDGGVASNLPIAIARRAGARRILAVDVALADRPLREDESAVALALTLLDRVNRRGQAGDTTGAGDARVWIPLAGVSPAAWNSTELIIAQGYRDSRDSIRSWVHAAGLPRLARPAPDRMATLPPIAGPIRWFDRHGHAARRTREADAVFGRYPEGRFMPAELAPGIERVHRAGLFDSSWPWLRVSGDSTLVGMQVKEYAPLELRGAFAYDNDTEARGQASVAWRPVGRMAPGDVTVGATIRKYRDDVFGSLGPHPLERGSEGWFTRAGWRETQVRLFDASGLDRIERVGRIEITAGVQRISPFHDIVMLGAGGTRVRSAGRDLAGPLFALRAEGRNGFHRVIEAAWRTGHEGYGAGSIDLDRTVTVNRNYAFRTAFAGSMVSDGAPLDEWRGLGGPGSMPGLRADEWMGRRMAAAELRVTRVTISTLRVHASVDVGTVEDAVSRPDLSGRIHVGAGIGLAFASVVGPLTLDYGIMDQSRFRVDVRIGQAF